MILAPTFDLPNRSCRPFLGSTFLNLFWKLLFHYEDINRLNPWLFAPFSLPLFPVFWIFHILFQVPKSSGLSELFCWDECLTDPKNEVVLNGVLSFASWGAEGTAGPFGALLLLAGGLPSSLCPFRGPCGWGGVGCWASCCGGGGRHLERQWWR